MLIYKEELMNNTGFQEIKLPYDDAEEARANILHIGMQYDAPHMWFDALRDELKEFLIVCIGTGHDWGDKLRREEYIGSMVVADGMFVWHYFLLGKEDFLNRLKNYSE